VGYVAGYWVRGFRLWCCILGKGELLEHRGIIVIIVMQFWNIIIIIINYNLFYNLININPSDDTNISQILHHHTNIL